MTALRTGLAALASRVRRPRPGRRRGRLPATVRRGLAALAALALAGRLPAGLISAAPADKPPRPAVAEAEQLS